MAEFKVTGLAELQKLLDTLPEKLQKNVLRGALRAGIKVIQAEAKANIHSVSGELARTLDDRRAIRTSARGNRVVAKLVAGVGLGKKGREPRNLPIWMEFGTAAHTIAARSGGWLFFGFGVFAKVVRHPGTRPRPFMRPALDSKGAAATIAAGEYMKQRLSTKNGIDTAYIIVEGDE